MTRTFAIDIIESFQSDEAERFRSFLDSSYHLMGFNSEVKLFFEHLRTVIDQGKIEALDKKEIFSLIFPGKPFLESKFDKLMSDLKRLLERFLLSERYFSTENDLRQQLDLAGVMRLRGLENRYIQTLEKAKKVIEGVKTQSLEGLFLHYLLAIEEREWHSTYNKAKGNLNIPEVIDQLELYFFTRKTTLINQFLLQQKATTIDDYSNSGFVTVSPPHQLLEASPLLKITFEINNLLLQPIPDLEDFEALMELISKFESCFNPETTAEFYTYLRNICVILIDNGQVQLNQALCQINQDNLSRGYFYKNGKIGPNAYLNITTVAINAGEVEWAHAFVEAHKDRIIDENETHDFYHMNKALCLFGEKKFQEALDTIPFGSTYSFYHLMARRLELKIYYELHSDLLDHKIDAFKMFISRAGKKVFSPQIHELFANFVNFVRQLSQSHGPQAGQRSEVLIKRISEKKVVAERMWLLEKARELGKKKS